MNATVLDPYAALGIPAGASRDEAARAHRRLAKEFHPDVNPGPHAAERMRRINEAWRILSDPARRERYEAQRVARGRGPHAYGTRTRAAEWATDDFGTGATAAWTTWPQSSTPRMRRPARPDPVEPSFGDRPAVVIAVVIGLALMYFIGTWLGSVATA